MKVFLKNNVLEEAKERIRCLYKQGKGIIVGTSGGKDSTVVLELTIEIAKEFGRLPVKAYFLDQESEFEKTIEYMRRLKKRTDEIDLFWFQAPFVLANSTSINQDFLDVWGEESRDKWIREKEPDSIHEFQTDKVRFFDVIKTLSREIIEGDYITLIGLRSEESRNRFINMCKKPIYKKISWISRAKYKNCFRAYPIYDWKFKDIWKYIDENKLDYNKIYDVFYQRGVSTRNARVSSIIHEMGVHSLKILQEIEPKTYNSLIKRIDGVSSYGQDYESLYTVNHDVMGFKFFANPKEYICYVIEMLCKDEHKHKFYGFIDTIDRLCRERDYDPKTKYTSIISSILLNDYHGAKIDHVIRSIYANKKKCTNK